MRRAVFMRRRLLSIALFLLTFALSVTYFILARELSTLPKDSGPSGHVLRVQREFVPGLVLKFEAARSVFFDDEPLMVKVDLLNEAKQYIGFSHPLFLDLLESGEG